MSTAALSAVSLKGSSEILTDYFFYAVNSILYQRGIYPETSFKKNTKYELSVLVAADEALIKYLNSVLEQMKRWIMMGAVQKLVLVVKCVKTEEVLERWQFNIAIESEDAASGNRSKPLSVIQEEIRSVMRQIVATNTILPVLTNTCTFELLIYTSRNAEIPDGWDESGPQFVSDSNDIKLRSFSTTVHRVDHVISHKRIY